MIHFDDVFAFFSLVLPFSSCFFFIFIFFQVVLRWSVERSKQDWLRSLLWLWLIDDELMHYNQVWNTTSVYYYYTWWNGMRVLCCSKQLVGVAVAHIKRLSSFNSWKERVYNNDILFLLPWTATVVTLVHCRSATGLPQFEKKKHPCRWGFKVDRGEYIPCKDGKVEKWLELWMVEA